MRDDPLSNRFATGELDEEIPLADRLQVLATARELEWLASTDDVAPSADFAGRVMAAVKAEPTPRPVVAAASAARRGALVGMLGAIRDLWRVAVTGGRPLAARVPALALVVVLLVVVVGGGALGAGTIAGLLGRPPSSAAPVATPVTSPTALPASPVLPSESPDVSASPEPSESPDPGESADPGESSTQSGGSTPAIETPRPTPAPTRTSHATETPKPAETPHPTQTPQEEESPRPSGG